MSRYCNENLQFQKYWLLVNEILYASFQGSLLFVVFSLMQEKTNLTMTCIITIITFISVRNFFMITFLVLFKCSLSVKRERARITFECFKVKMVIQVGEKVSHFYATPRTVITSKEVIIMHFKVVYKIAFARKTLLTITAFTIKCNCIRYVCNKLM